MTKLAELRNNRRPIRFQGRFSYSSTSTSVVNTPINPRTTLDDRAAAISDLYTHWRVIRMDVRTMTSPTAASPYNGFKEINVAATLNLFEGTAPTTFEMLEDMQFYSSGNGAPGAPFPRITMAHADFKSQNQINWWNTGVSGSYDDEFEYLLSIFTLCSQADSNAPYVVVVEYELEFIDPADPTVALGSPGGPPAALTARRAKCNVERLKFFKKCVDQGIEIRTPSFKRFKEMMKKPSVAIPSAPAETKETSSVLGATRPTDEEELITRLSRRKQGFPFVHSGSNDPPPKEDDEDSEFLDLQLLRIVNPRK